MHLLYRYQTSKVSELDIRRELTHTFFASSSQAYLRHFHEVVCSLFTCLYDELD